MDFSFNPNTFRDLFHNSVEPYLEAEPEKDDMNSPANLLAAMDQAIDVMVRADADSAVQQDMSAESMGRLEQEDISKIGEYALDLLEAMVAIVEKKTGKQNRELLRSSLPLSLWVARHGGKLSQIDMVVNSLAGYANEIAEPYLLAELTRVIQEVIDDDGSCCISQGVIVVSRNGRINQSRILQEPVEFKVIDVFGIHSWIT